LQYVVFLFIGHFSDSFDLSFSIFSPLLMVLLRTSRHLHFHKMNKVI